MTEQLGGGKRSERPAFPLNTMRSFITIIACLLAAWLIACDSATGPNDGNKEFLFRVEVSDPDGKPVPNLRISGYNELTGIDPFLHESQPAASDRMEPTWTTSIPFVVAEKSHIQISTFDMNNDPIAVISSEVLPEGLHTVRWGSGFPPTPGVYRCQMTAKDTLTGELIFEDAIYPVMWTVDPEQSVYGFTNPVGVYETSNELLFPNVLEGLPMLVHINAAADSVGTFEFKHTVVITLTDTSTYDTMRLRKVVNAGRNTYSVVWKPNSQGATVPTSNDTGTTPSILVPIPVRNGDPPEFEWRLGYNYPNPFN